jgi:protein TonB
MSEANASPIGRSHHEVSDAIIFRDLPATFPEEDRYKKPSVIGSIVFHGVLIVMVVIIPLMLPQAIPDRELLITLVAPLAPPPPPPPPPVQIALPAAPKVVKRQVLPATPEALIMPTAIPRDIARIVDEPVSPVAGVVGGVPGGMPGGVADGILGGVLSANATPTAPPALAPPPPPPPPPPVPAAPVSPVRVGGAVREPQLVKMVPPVYPKVASMARVSGTVVVEATLTERGTVEEIRVISGHPLLVEAAIDSVKQWQYEPTLLNGIPVPIILTAKVNFLRRPLS